MQQNHIGSLIQKNAIVDEGDGAISIKNGLTLTDDSTQKNGTKYEVKTLDVSKYDGRLFADHGDPMGGYTIEKVIGRLKNVRKEGKRVVADGIEYAVNSNPLALFAYNMTKEGFLTDFSIGTQGAMPDDEGVYKEHELFEVSQVGIGNHPKARINELAINSIEQAEKNGLDTTGLKQMLELEDEEETTNNKEEEEEMSDTPKPAEDKKVEEPEVAAQGATLDVEAIKNAFSEIVTPLTDKIEKLEKNAFDKEAEEPAFTNSGKPAQRPASKNKQYEDMSWQDRAVNQIESFRLMSKSGDQEAAKLLHTINNVNLEALKKENVVKNDMTIGDLGNFVISPEQLSEIQGFRSDYSALVNRFAFRETLSTQTQWLKRSGDIDMTAVDYDDSAITAAGYLKPVSDYTASLETMTLEELAAVTPVANSATRFLAADILGDVSAGYRTDYERKLAQLIVARLEQATDGNGNSVTYSTSSDTNAGKSVLNTIKQLAEEVGSGTLVMNYKSYWEIQTRLFGAGVSGQIGADALQAGIGRIGGIETVVVPNDLMPELNSAETVAHTVDGGSVNIGHSVFYVNPQNWVGRTSGGLMYDLSTDAAYESGGTVYSAFQRNQIVLRGSFFRGGQVADTDLVSGLLSEGVS